MMHPDLIALGRHTYYVSDTSNIGIYVSGADAFLIDSGRDRDAGKRVLRLLNESGLHLAGIINTHSHADHIGGNAYLQQQTGCRIWAPEKEVCFITNPEMESAFLYGGFPHAGLQGKLLKAKPSRVTAVFQPPEAIAGTMLQAISLPGHCFGMAGIMTPDGVCFTSDALLPMDLLEHHRIPYIFDVAGALETLEQLPSIEATCYLPGHGFPMTDIAEAAQANRSRILEIHEVLLSFMKHPVTPGELFSLAAEHFGITLNHVSFVLTQSTISSCVSYLLAKQLCTLSYRQNAALLSRS